MSDLRPELDEKRQQLNELIKSRSKASCSSRVSSKVDVERETRIEDLEERILELEKKLG